MTNPTPSVVPPLRDSFGEALRGVGLVRDNEYNVLYMRDDIEPQYSNDALDEIGRDLILESLRKEPLEDVYVAGGEYEFSSIGFRRMVILLFTVDGGTGLVLSIELDFFDDLNSVVDTLQELSLGADDVDADG